MTPGKRKRSLSESERLLPDTGYSTGLQRHLRLARRDSRRNNLRANRRNRDRDEAAGHVRLRFYPIGGGQFIYPQISPILADIFRMNQSITNTIGANQRNLRT
ncbi:MAG TPA: hypothetical protein PLL45_02690, partial [Thermoflexales bacterium]|nr:hypothetical protein [Thermoflexales bacterium]